MKREQIPDGFKISLSEKEVYTYDKDSDQWKLGRREATREELSMIEFIVEQLDPPTTEQVNRADIDVSTGETKPAEIVKSGKTLPRPTKAIPREAEPVEAKDKDVISKKEILSALKEDREQNKRKKDQAKPESLLEEQKRSKSPLLVKIQNVSEVAKAISDILQKSTKPAQIQTQQNAPTQGMQPVEQPTDSALTANFKKRMREKNPWLRLFTDVMETAEDKAKGKTPKRGIFGKVYGKKTPANDIEVPAVEIPDQPKTKPADLETPAAERLDQPKTKPADLEIPAAERLDQPKTKPADLETPRTAAKTTQTELLDEISLTTQDSPTRSTFRQKINKKIPWLDRVFGQRRTTSKTSNKSLLGRIYEKSTGPKAEAISAGAKPISTGSVSDGQRRMAEKLGSTKATPSDFTPKYGTRTELNRLTDLTEGEKELLADRGIAPASEKDFSYRKDGKPLSKARLLEELDLAHEEGALKSGFKQKMREKNPWLRLFTNKMESPEDIAAGKTPKMSITGTKTFKSAKAGAAKLVEKVKASNVFKKAAGVFNKSAEKITGKVATKTAAKTAGKSVGKSVLKKIPGVGLITGLALGIGRLMKGDLTGAVGEIASGAASTVPGIGTAASTAIDVGLAARDMSSEQQSNDDSVDAVKEARKPQMFAKGGVVEGATPFNHSGGTGVMGEAGPEAIMPLKRDSSGNLGVSAEPVSKDALTNQTASLKQTDEELKKREAVNQQQPPAPTIINSSTTNNTMGGGGSESRVTAASPRGSLATNYFAF